MVLHKEFMKINFLQRIITARSLQKRIYVPSTGISGHSQAPGNCPVWEKGDLKDASLTKT